MAPQQRLASAIQKTEVPLQVIGQFVRIEARHAVTLEKDKD
jgi:hypothetical protein